MKHLKNSLVVFASLLVIGGVVTFFIPSLTQGMSDNVPKSAFSISRRATGFNAIVSGPDPEGTSYGITSLTVANHGSNSVSVFAYTLLHATTDCLAGQPSVGPTVRVPAGETVHISFPQPFVLSAQPSATSCLFVDWSDTASLDFTVVGYRF